MPVGGKGTIEGAGLLISELTQAPDWAYVEALILPRYDDATLVFAIRMLGGGALAPDTARARLVELLHERYRHHSGTASPSASNRSADCSLPG